MANNNRRKKSRSKRTSGRSTSRSSRTRSARRKPRKKVGRWILLAMLLFTAAYLTYPVLKNQIIVAFSSADKEVATGEAEDTISESSAIEDWSSDLISESKVNLVPEWWTVFVDSTWTPLLREKFPVNEVVINGLYSVEEFVVSDAIGDLSGLSIFEVPIEDIELTLEKHTRISRALLKRSYPTTLKVDIVENYEVAAVILNGKPYGVDKDGLVLVDGKLGYSLDVPLISGLNLKTKPGEIIRNDVFQEALSWVAISKDLPRTSQWISSIIVDEDGVIALQGINNCNVLPGSQSVHAQMATLDKFLATDDYTQRIGYEVDLRFPGFLILRNS